MSLFEGLNIPFISELSVSPYIQIYVTEAPKCNNYIEKYHMSKKNDAISWICIASLLPMYIIAAQCLSSTSPFKKDGRMC